MKIQPVNYIKSQIDWAKGFFSEDNGKSSNKRLLSSLVVGTFIIPYFKVSIASQKLEDIPQGWMIMIASILGLNIIDWFVKGYIGKNTPPTNNGNNNVQP
jgi:hypothetical protein